MNSRARCDCYTVSTFASSHSQKWLNIIFQWLSVQIPRKPFIFISIGLLITVLCSLGLLNLYLENRFLYMVVPRDSPIWHRYMQYMDQFGETPPMMSILVTTDTTNNILEASNLNACYDIFNIIYNESIIHYNDLYYTSICMRDYPSAVECASTYSNIFGAIFANNASKWQNKQNVISIINEANSNVEYFIGGIERDIQNDLINKGTVLRISYDLEENNDNTYAYQKEFDDYWAAHTDASHINSNLSQIYHMTDRSLDDELNRILVIDAGVFAAAFITMLIYLMLLLGSFDCIGFRLWLATSVVLIVICSYGIGAGLACAMNVDMSIIAMLVPYILIGVGVDDMIILCDSYDRYQKDLTLTLQYSGLSISLTSLCSFLAFFIASLTPNANPSVYTFCITAAISFLALYLIQFLIFIPLMIYDERRMDSNRNFCCFCYKHKTNTNVDKMSKNGPGYHLNLAYILNKTIVRILQYRVFRWITIVIFLVVLCFAAYCVPLISTETDPATMVPRDSFVLDYRSVFESLFDANMPIECGVVIQHEDFSNSQTRDNIYQLFDALSEHPNYIYISDWLQPFEQYLTNDRNIDINNITNHMFYDELNIFVNITQYKQWQNEIFYAYNIENDSYYIKATRFYLFSFRAEAFDEQWSEYVQYNNIMSESNVNGYIFEKDYGLAYLVDIIVELTIQNMFFCAIGVLIVLSLFMDIRIAIFCFIIVVMIDVWLIGWMYVLNISLEPVSYCSLVMAVGLTIDYIIHITVAIASAQPNNKNDYKQRLQIAMHEMGGSVLKGALTTLLGGFPLVFSNSKGFTLFYYMVAGIVICSLLHGMIFVPAILGEMTWIYSKPNYKNHIKNTLIESQTQMGIDKKEFVESQQSLISMSNKKRNNTRTIENDDQDDYGSI